jgi:hypothetical protein
MTERIKEIGGHLLPLWKQIDKKRKDLQWSDFLIGRLHTDVVFQPRAQPEPNGHSSLQQN